MVDGVKEVTQGQQDQQAPIESKPPIYIAVCIPHGTELLSIQHVFSFLHSVAAAGQSYDGRLILPQPFDLVGDEYARARNGLVQMVKDRERDQGFRFEYLFWIDDDVILPPDTLPKLLSHNVPIASGLYFMRKPPHLPVAYMESKDPLYRGRFWSLDSFPENALFEVDAVGHGCTLIKREVYDSVPEPYYAWRDVYREADDSFRLSEGLTKEQAKTQEDKTLGEDLYFFSKCRLHGYKILLDTSVSCGHFGTQVFDISFFKAGQYHYHKIAPAGRLNILIIPAPSPAPWDGNTIKTGPLGGSETMVSQLAYWLANRHHHIVYVCSGYSVAPNIIDGVHYRPTEMAMELIKQPWDVVIVSRWSDLLPHVSANKDIKALVFWSHDIIMKGEDRREIYKHSNAFVCVSNWHGAISFDPDDPSNDDEMAEVIMPNAVDLRLFEGGETRYPGRMVWTSNPNRGLWTAIRIFRKLRRRWPMLELHIYGRSSIYGWSSTTDPMWEGPYLPEPDEPNVYLHEPLNKADLARELMKAWVLFYPTTWPETFSLAVLEAQAAGTPVICNPYAALSETMYGGAFATLDKPGFDFEGAVEALMDRDEWELQSLRGLEFARSHGWENISDRWEQFLRDEIKRYEEWQKKDRAKAEAGMRWRG